MLQKIEARVNKEIERLLDKEELTMEEYDVLTRECLKLKYIDAYLYPATEGLVV